MTGNIKPTVACAHSLLVPLDHWPEFNLILERKRRWNSIFLYMQIWSKNGSRPLKKYRSIDHYFFCIQLFFSGSVPSIRRLAFSRTWFLSTTWHDTQWRPQLRLTTRSLGPWSRSTWEKFSTGSAQWNSRCVWNWLTYLGLCIYPSYSNMSDSV